MFEFLEISKSEVVKWCLDNSFEYIEMISEEEESEDDEGKCKSILSEPDMLSSFT